MEYKIGERIPVLDKGHIILHNVVGDDWSIVDAARVSFGSGRKGEDQDTKLINYLVKHQHDSPMEMADISFIVKCPIFVARQWIRHRIGIYPDISVNEISYRYVVFEDEVYIPDVLRGQSKSNKQASGAPIEGDELLQSFRDSCNASIATYRQLIDRGVAREMARMVLPVGTYTEFMCKYNLRSALHFATLRDAPNAQYEIRVYAQHVHSIIAQYFPRVYNAWVKYRLPMTI